MTAGNIEFIYIADAMCSWCWGFAPSLESLDNHYSIPTRLVVGGLRPGPNAQVMDDGMRAYLQHHWERVAEASGQPFDPATLQREGWVYDTEFPARAIVTMRALAPEAELDWFKRLQRAFYAEGIDITDPAVYPDLVAEFPVDSAAFMGALEVEDSRIAAWEDFEEARVLQANGFPTLLLRTGNDLATVTRGYMPFAAIEPHLTAYLAERYDTAEFLNG